MGYYIKKIMIGTIREAIVKVLEQRNAVALKKTGNPYATLEFYQQIDPALLNSISKQAYDDLKQKGLIPNGLLRAAPKHFERWKSNRPKNEVNTRAYRPKAQHR